MKYLKTKDINLEKSYFHFTRTANRDSIEKSGLKSVGDGENGTGSDKNHKTIFFSYEKDGLIENFNSWIRWEYNTKIKKRDDYYKMLPTDKIDENVMNEIYEKVYNDFKERIYLKLDLEEGKDFDRNQIDYKKVDDLNAYKEELKKYEKGEQKWKPSYPNKVVKWMYGNYSVFGKNNTKVDKWNMFTKENITLSPEKISIMESENGRSDALSYIMEVYDKYKDELIEKGDDLSTIDSFMEYAREKYKNDKDYANDSPDIGRREVSKEEEKIYQERNGLASKIEEVKNSKICRESQMNDASNYIEKNMNKEKEMLKK